MNDYRFHAGSLLHIILINDRRKDMKLLIDGYVYWVRPEQSLLDIIKEFGLITGKLSTDPIAAKIAGEVFTLNYIPMRMEDAAHERESIRKAMAASGGKVSLLRYSDPSGKDAYRRTAQFVLFLAVRKLWPNAVAKMNCTVGEGVYIKVTGAEDFSAERLKECVRELIAEDIPLVRRRIPTADAIDYFSRQGQIDKARLLAYRAAPTLDVYGYGDFFDYYYGEMAPSTGFLRVWDIIPAQNGFIFIFPDRNDPDRVSDYHEMTQFMEVYDEGKRCAETLFMDYHRQNNLRIKIIRIFNTYGPRMSMNDGRVVSNFIVQALRGENITIYGDGKQTRSFQYVDDLVEGMVRMMETDDSFTGPVNIGNPGEFTMLELAQKVIELTGSASKIVFEPLPQDDPRQRKPDITLAHEKLGGWQPSIKLDEGLGKTIEYFKRLV